jgi:hypothetical protein
MILMAAEAEKYRSREGKLKQRKQQIKMRENLKVNTLKI